MTDKKPLSERFRLEIGYQIFIASKSDSDELIELTAAEIAALETEKAEAEERERDAEKRWTKLTNWLCGKFSKTAAQSTSLDDVKELIHTEIARLRAELAEALRDRSRAIPVSERLPTRSDRDGKHEVEWWDERLKAWYREDWEHDPPDTVTHFRKIDNTPPETEERDTP